MNLTRHRRSQGGSKRPAPLSIKMPPMIKTITTSLMFFQFLLAFLVYNSIQVQQININFDDQVARDPSN